MQKLGRKAVKHDSRTLKLCRYLGPELPAPPARRDWIHIQDEFGMMMNDQLGDCIIAGAAHAVQVWSMNAAKETTVGDKDVVAAYQQWDGYDPADPSTDHGGVELDVLNNWRKDGLAGHELLAFASVNPHIWLEVQQAINLFGGIYIGVALPMTAQTQEVWDYSSDGENTPGSWGGHCVFVTGYDQKEITCITWGKRKHMTLRFFQFYCDEAYALLGQDWIEASGEAPSGFNKDQLLADLALIR